MRINAERFSTQQWGTFQTLWEQAVATYGAAPFMAFQDAAGVITEWSYSQFDKHVTAMAEVLHSHGVRRGDSIHLCLDNSPVFIGLWLATSRLGASFVPVDPNSTAREINNQVSRVRPILGVCSTKRAKIYLQGVSKHNLKTIQVTEEVTDLFTGIGRLTQEPKRHQPADDLSPDDRLATMFTSGTTSEPKGVLLTQANYASVGMVMAEAAELQQQHRWLVTLPLFHANAQFYCFATAIAVGASVGLTYRFSASRWISQTRELGATHASLFAAPVRMILARTPENVPPANLQHIWFAQSLGPGHFSEFTKLTGVTPRQLYGMTETVAVVSYDSGEKPTHDQIGWPVPGRQVQLLDPSTSKPAAPGVPGVITLAGVRGRDFFDGYMDAPEINATAFSTDANGTEWFSTGDLATQDENGQLRFVGRVDDVIKVSGENISLTEIESAAAEAPGIFEVAVVAKPDPIRDVVPIAYFVARDSEDVPTVTTLDAWARDNLVPAARPREWHQLEELPRTSVGKIRRFQLTED